ncbi:MAG: hypothetical protein QHC90_25970 [Shinella sp.]|nr:hypothetical protein [Shinella sp.]
MSVLIDSLKAQNAFLQSEVERFAKAVDNLAAQLAEVQDRLAEFEADDAYEVDVLTDPTDAE